MMVNLNETVVPQEDRSFPIKRMWFRVQKLYCFVCRGWRFHTFGWGTVIRRWDMLTNPFMISIGKNVLIRKGARLEAVGKIVRGEAKLTIGDGTAIQFYFHCGAAHSIRIGNNVLIAGRVYITDHDHIYDSKKHSIMEYKFLRAAPVVIEDNVWLGEGVVVLKGVTIGEGSVVGANAVVNKDIPSYSVAVGVPARVVKTITPPSQNTAE